MILKESLRHVGPIFGPHGAALWARQGTWSLLVVRARLMSPPMSRRSTVVVSVNERHDIAAWGPRTIDTVTPYRRPRRGARVWARQACAHFSDCNQDG